MSETAFTAGGIATLACLLEVSAPKPGNVHRGADFEDTTFNDFLTSAVALGQAIDAHADAGIGETVLAAVKATRRATKSNTNLGMILLLVPLAKAFDSRSVSPPDLAAQLARLTDADTAGVFEAIRLANPGGLGTADAMDVRGGDQSNDGSLIEAMQLSADRDLVARQYVNEFEHVFAEVVPLLVENRLHWHQLSEAIVVTHVMLMARHPDSLIARKCGSAVAAESQTRAQQVVDLIPTTSDDLAHEQFWSAVGDFDFWLRSDGHRRNPGTTADLIAAGLFVALANEQISPPWA